MQITHAYIKAKNGLLLNVGIMLLIVVLSLSWYFSVAGGVKNEKEELLEASQVARNVMDQGLLAVSDEDLLTMGTNEVRAKKIQQLQRLFPESRSYVFSSDPAETKRLQDLTLTLVDKPRNVTKNYHQWLASSITPEMESALKSWQQAFGEVLPVFVSIDPDVKQTKGIEGKVDLKSIVTLVEDELFQSQGIENVEGALGIRNVVFDEINPELGYYDISTRIQDVPSSRVMQLLEYIGKLWAIQTEEQSDGLLGIKHLFTLPSRKNQIQTYHLEGRSALSNPLVVVPSLIVEPAGDILKDTSAPDLDSHLSLSPRSRFRKWNAVITLRFFVRGASDDHIQTIESQIQSLVHGSIKRTGNMQEQQEDNLDWSLSDRIENALLVDCDNCIEQQNLKQLRNDLDALTTVHNDFVATFGTKDDPEPLERIQTDLYLLDAFLNIQLKLDELIRKLS